MKKLNTVLFAAFIFAAAAVFTGCPTRYNDLEKMKEPMHFHVPTNYGDLKIKYTQDGSDFIGSVTIKAGAKNTWKASDTSDIEFGVVEALKDWKGKFVGAELKKADEWVECKKDGANNKIDNVNPSDKDVTIHVKFDKDGKCFVKYTK